MRLLKIGAAAVPFIAVLSIPAGVIIPLAITTALACRMMTGDPFYQSEEENKKQKNK